MRYQNSEYLNFGIGGRSMARRVSENYPAHLEANRYGRSTQFLAFNRTSNFGGFVSLPVEPSTHLGFSPIVTLTISSLCSRLSTADREILRQVHRERK
jgi:hypothetical protein